MAKAGKMVKCDECDQEYLKVVHNRRFCSMTCKRRNWFNDSSYEQNIERQRYKARWIKIRRIEKLARGFTWYEIKRDIKLINECYWCGKEISKLYCNDEHRRLFETELRKELYPETITIEEVETLDTKRYSLEKVVVTTEEAKDAITRKQASESDFDTMTWHQRAKESQIRLIEKYGVILPKRD